VECAASGKAVRPSVRRRRRRSAVCIWRLIELGGGLPSVGALRGQAAARCARFLGQTTQFSADFILRGTRLCGTPVLPPPELSRVCSAAAPWGLAQLCAWSGLTCPMQCSARPTRSRCRCVARQERCRRRLLRRDCACRPRRLHHLVLHQTGQWVHSVGAGRLACIALCVDGFWPAAVARPIACASRNRGKKMRADCAVLARLYVASQECGGCTCTFCARGEVGRTLLSCGLCSDNQGSRLTGVGLGSRE